MCSWFWRVIALKSAFIITCLFHHIRCDDGIRKLPFCSPNNLNPVNDLVIVSTLDGKVTAFYTENGATAWQVETQPLLSSNLHHVELAAGNKWVRLVPSLRGQLYSLTSDSIESLPLDAEQLLSSSYQYSEDMVIAGARETSWLGIDAANGGVVYTCGAGGCGGEAPAAHSERNVLVLRRQAATVRAVDPRNGNEKWNFSVGEHQLSLGGRSDCVGRPSPPTPRAAAIAVGIPEGVVAARAPGSGALMWRRQLNAPVTEVWQLNGNALYREDLLWQATHSLADDYSSLNGVPPSLYVGVHDKQIYVQEGLFYSQKVETALSSTAQIPWKLQSSRPLLAGSETALAAQDADTNALSLLTLYGNTGLLGNHGFFLYLQEKCDQAVQVDENSIDNQAETIQPNDSEEHIEHHHIHVHVYSLWFWWKEVLLIAISSALLLNLMIWPRLFSPKMAIQSPLPLNQEYIVVERHYERPAVKSAEYCGRYEKDFTPLRCLGRGGFGIVFEARNNIDHGSYAVKRITLPKRASRRERVLREVRVLAKLEHENIVRYFNAWIEEPPPQWQEDRDNVLFRELEGAECISEDYTYTSHPSKSVKPTKGDSVSINLHRTENNDINSRELKRQRSFSCNDSFSITFDCDTKAVESKSSVEKSKIVDSNSNDDFSIEFANSKSVEKDHVSATNGSNDDSLVIFDSKHGNTLPDVNIDAVNKTLDKVKASNSSTDKTETTKPKRKKGHRRHWSLDMCVAGAEGPANMYLYIQMQLCRRDSLHDWLRDHTTTQSRRDQIQTLFSQILSAVEYVHLAGLIHRDLKPSNIFFAPDGRVKVGDFGLVTTMTDTNSEGGASNFNAQVKHTKRVGTHLYMSPEQMNGKPYSYKVDIYSLGVILFELLAPFATEAERVATLGRLRRHQYPDHFGDTYPNEKEVLSLMLSEDPEQRPTASGVRARAPLYQCTDERWHFTLPNIAAC